MSGRPGRRSADDWRWRREFVSDVFHTISQPLTAVHVSLELALKKKRAAEQRSAIREALAITASAVEKARFVRLLAEAGDPGEVAEFDLHRVISSLSDEMAPVAEAQGSKIVWRGTGPVMVRADEARIGQAFFLLAEVALRACSRREFHICLDGGKRFARVTFGAALGRLTGRKRGMVLIGCEQDERAASLARAMIGAIGGEIEHWRSDANECWGVRIPRLLRAGGPPQ